MSSGKLDLALDDIVKSHRNTNRRRGARRSGAGRPSDAPVGGVHKPTKQTKPTKATANPPVHPTGGETKILISNLPRDVDENQLKEYLASILQDGRPKRILMQYGANGQSLGSATIIFNKADQAKKTTAALDKVKIDGRPIRVEMLVNPAAVPTPAAQASLSDRITKPKTDKPKPATANKPAPAGGRGRDRGRGRGGRRGGGRERGGKKKTLEELDAEMEDYFPTAEGANDAMVTNGTAPPANAGGDTAMDDEML
jgi:THO complex subunit 4